MSTATAFHRVSVIVSPINGANTIEWFLSQRYQVSSDSVEFYVEVARGGEGVWTRLNPSTPVTDTNVYVDLTSYNSSIKNDLYYRVVMVDGLDTITSMSAGVTGSLTGPERRIIMEVLRRKYLQLRHRTGQPGYLLRKREWGTPCTCIDPDTGVPATQSCPLCYGAGILGGYYPPIPFFMEMLEQTPVQLSVDDVTPRELTVKQKALCICYPSIWPRDLWVSADTGERFLVDGEIKPEVSVRSTVAIQAVTLELLPPGRPQYDVPITEDQLEGPPGWGKDVTFIPLSTSLDGEQQSDGP